MKFKATVHHVLKQCKKDVHAKTGNSMSVVFTAARFSQKSLHEAVALEEPDVEPSDGVIEQVHLYHGLCPLYLHRILHYPEVVECVIVDYC